jgi:hypothetical protein
VHKGWNAAQNWPKLATVRLLYFTHHLRDHPNRLLVFANLVVHRRIRHPTRPANCENQKWPEELSLSIKIIRGLHGVPHHNPFNLCGEFWHLSRECKSVAAHSYETRQHHRRLCSWATTTKEDNRRVFDPKSFDMPTPKFAKSIAS